MVRKYQRISSRKSWPAARMEAAVRSVTEKGSSVKRAAEEHKAPRKTLAKYLKLNENTPGASLEMSLGCYEHVFNARQEEELVNHILDLEKRCYGIGPRDVRSLAFELAERSNINHPFNRDTEPVEHWPVGISFMASEPGTRNFLSGLQNPRQLLAFKDSIELLLKIFSVSLRKQEAHKSSPQAEYSMWTKHQFAR